MKCHNCGRIFKVIKTPEDYRKEREEAERERRENIHVYCSGKSWSSGIKYYKLSTHLEPEEWQKVKKYFGYNHYDPENDEFDCEGTITGWVTRQPEKVEEALGDLIKPENRISEIVKKEKEDLEKRRQKQIKIIQLKDKLRKAFKNAETPANIKPNGEIYPDPSYMWNCFGGGRKFVLNKEANQIWLVRNNGADGDDWSRNNVETAGAGAIGYMVPYTDELANTIKRYIHSFKD